MCSLYRVTRVNKTQLLLWVRVATLMRSGSKWFQVQVPIADEAWFFAKFHELNCKCIDWVCLEEWLTKLQKRTRV